MAGDGRRSWTVQSQPVSTSGFPGAASAADRAVTAERCAAQLLCGDRAGSPEEVARRLVAIQAQDPRGARLAVRARSAGLSASDVDSALARRSMVVTWLNRGTLHLVRAEDYWWLHPLTTPQLRTGNSRRLAQEGVPPQDAERAVAAVRAVRPPQSAGGPEQDPAEVIRAHVAQLLEETLKGRLRVRAGQGRREEGRDDRGER